MAIFTNQATLTYNNGSTNSNVTVGEILEVLTVTKTALQDTYGPGEDVTYIVSIVNTGTAPFTGLTVTDDLGGFELGGVTRYPLTYRAGSVRYFVNGVLQTPPTVNPGPPLTVTGLTVPAGGNAMLLYEATTNAYAPIDTEGTIENTVTVTGGGLNTPITATETIAAEAAPRLTITKALNPTTVAENGQITYTFIVQNTGNVAAVATDNLAITDTFTPALGSITVTFNGDPVPQPGNYTYDPATGLFTTVPGRLTVPAATFTRDPATGAVTVTPGVSVLTVTGTI